MRVVGLSIEGTVLRASFAERRFMLTRIVGQEETSLPRVSEERALVLRELLLKWKAEHGIGGVVLGLDLKDFTHNYIELPVSRRADIERALEFELEKHLPLPPDEYLCDFATVSEQGGITRNLVFSIRRDKLWWLVPALEDTGLELMGVRCKAIEALNHLIRTESGSEVVFSYPEGHATYVFGIGNEMPEVIRTAYSESKAAAQVDNLAGQYKQGIFSGEPSSREEFAGLSVKFIRYSVPELIALSAFRRGRVGMDFTPEALRPPVPDYVHGITLLVAALAVLMFFATEVMSYYMVKAEAGEIEARVERIRGASSGLLAGRKELEEIGRKLDYLKAREAGANRHIALLTHMSAVLPEEAWLIRFSAGQDGKVEIEGYANRTVDVITRIEASEQLGGVDFSAPVTVRDNLEKFSLKMEYSR